MLKSIIINQKIKFKNPYEWALRVHKSCGMMSKYCESTFIK